MASIRQQLLTAIQTRLQAITVANGYSSNLGAKVFPYRTSTWPDSDLPGIQWEAVASQTQDLFHADQEFTVTLVIRALGTPLTSAIFDKVQDVQSAIGTDERFGGLVQACRIAGEIQVAVDQADKIYTAAQIPLTIYYRTDLWQS